MSPCIVIEIKSPNFILRQLLLDHSIRCFGICYFTHAPPTAQVRVKSNQTEREELEVLCKANTKNWQCCCCSGMGGLLPGCNYFFSFNFIFQFDFQQILLLYYRRIFVVDFCCFFFQVEVARRMNEKFEYLVTTSNPLAKAQFILSTWKFIASPLLFPLPSFLSVAVAFLFIFVCVRAPIDSLSNGGTALSSFLLSLGWHACSCARR